MLSGGGALFKSHQEAETGAHFCEFDVILVYRASTRTGAKTREKPCLKNERERKKVREIVIAIILLLKICSILSFCI